MKTLSLLNKKELLHELFAANAEFLYTLRGDKSADVLDRQFARRRLNEVLQEVEKRKNATSVLQHSYLMRQSFSVINL